jgi:hypothetical protein
VYQFFPTDTVIAQYLIYHELNEICKETIYFFPLGHISFRTASWAPGPNATTQGHDEYRGARDIVIEVQTLMSSSIEPRLKAYY